MMVLGSVGTVVVALLLSAAPPASSEAPEAAAAENEEEELICRRKLQKSDKMGERYKSTKICKTRDEWEKERRR